MKYIKMKAADFIIALHTLLQRFWCNTGNITFAKMISKIESSKKINKFVANNILW